MPEASTDPGFVQGLLCKLQKGRTLKVPYARDIPELFQVFLPEFPCIAELIITISDKEMTINAVKRKIESEKVLDRKLSKRVADTGGWSIKLLTLHITGLPDRLCLLPGGRLFFAEIKTTGEKPKRVQNYVIDKLRALGFRVVVIDSTDSLDQIMTEYEW